MKNLIGRWVGASGFYLALLFGGADTLLWGWAIVSVLFVLIGALCLKFSIWLIEKN